MRRTSSGSFKLRHTRFHGVADIGPGRFKVYSIAAQGEPASEGELAEATSVAGEHLSQVGLEGLAGFCVLHMGEEAIWLQVCWWQSDILHRVLYRRPLHRRDPFSVEDDHTILACLWELHVIDHERRAWSRSLSTADDLTQYFEDSLAPVPHGQPLENESGHRFRPAFESTAHSPRTDVE